MARQLRLSPAKGSGLAITQIEFEGNRSDPHPKTTCQTLEPATGTATRERIELLNQGVSAAGQGRVFQRG